MDESIAPRCIETLHDALLRRHLCGSGGGTRRGIVRGRHFSTPRRRRSPNGPLARFLASSGSIGEHLIDMAALDCRIARVILQGGPVGRETRELYLPRSEATTGNVPVHLEMRHRSWQDYVRFVDKIAVRKRDISLNARVHASDEGIHVRMVVPPHDAAEGQVQRVRAQACFLRALAQRESDATSNAYMVQVIAVYVLLREKNVLLQVAAHEETVAVSSTVTFDATQSARTAHLSRCFPAEVAVHGLLGMRCCHIKIF
mmetsp:Transcript_15471/g.42302  ORF Transcript_15471/g.42302 Transcript_15471/m.42302 type:complete len:258 (+) Transcript_15471:253-1026(+)